MKNSEKIVEIQRRLFREIQNILTANYVAVDVVSELLKTGSDSAYRRIRGDKLLSIEELYILCQHFGISFDKLTGFRDSQSFDCIYRPNDIPAPGEYQKYMLGLSKNLATMKNSVEPYILMSASDIPVFHIIEQKELTFFKVYTWYHSVYNYEGNFRTPDPTSINKGF